MRVGVLALFLLAARAAIAAQPLHHDIVVTLDPTAGTVSVTDTVVIPQSGPVPIGLEGPFHRLSIKLNGESLATSRGASLVAKPKGGGPHRLHIAYAKDMSSPRAATGPEGIFLPPSARWLPVVGEGPFTYRLTLRMPSDQRGLVPGRLVDESVADGRYQAVFESETPSDGIVLVAGPYAVEERIHRGIRLRTYFHRDNAQLAAGYLESSARYLDLFGARIGAYPFSAFHVVSAPLPVGLGFPNFTYMGKRVLALPFIRHTSLGHEVLHSWWGNGVYTDYAAGNWSEGLTTYMADYAFAEARDAAKARDMRFRWLRDYAALPPDRDRPVVAFDFKRHDAAQVVGYHKVAFVFHMLRNRIGDPAFEAGLRRFWRGHKFRKAGWPDLKAAFAKESGQDLALFFDQWLHRKGAPTLAVEKVDVTPSGDGYRVGFSLLQDLSTYRLRVPVTVRTRSGETRTVVALQGRSRRTYIDVADVPLSLSVDPDYDVFRRLDPREAPPILRDVTLSADARAVVAAEGPAADHARALAARLLDTSSPVVDSEQVRGTSHPLLIVGVGDAPTQLLVALGLPEVPDAIAGRGTARVWAGRSRDRPYVVVAADDSAGLAALLRPLPHYKRRGYLVFEGARAVDVGNWPRSGGSLRVPIAPVDQDRAVR